MKKVRIDDLETPASGQFLRIAKKLTKAFIGRLFKNIKESVSKKKNLLANDVRKTRQHENEKYVYSFMCFEIESKPLFLKNTNLKETSYGYVLLIEQGNYLGLFKSGVSDIQEKLESVCKPIDQKALIRIYGKDAVYNKMSLTRMSISQHELRGCGYEASDLETTIPTLGINRSIPRFIRLEHPKAGTISILPGTSRVRKGSGKLNTNDLSRLILEIQHQIENLSNVEFLDAFATPVELAELPKNVHPTGMLFDLSGLVEGNEDAAHIILKNKSGAPKDYTGDLKKRFGEVLTLVSGNNGWFIINSKGCRYGFLKRNKYKLSLKLYFRSKLIVQRKETPNEVPLEKWLRENKCFSVCFNSPEHFYAHGQLYHRSGFENEVQTVRKTIKSIDSLQNVQSEKGRVNEYTSETTSFDVDSVFHIVETQICLPTDHIWCCDLGDEWADYIVLNKNNILSFYHCKGGEVTNGASVFQEVIGQALKNLGRIQVGREDLLKKIQTAESSGFWGKTKIQRLRGNTSSWEDFKRDANTLFADFNSKREVCLVVTMLSESQFNEEASKKRKEPHFLQLVWILASFINACREKGAQPYILCRP